MIKNIKLLALASLVFVGCNKDEDTVIPVANSSDGKELTAGTADFSKFVSLGNSLTAGFSDASLFRDGQLGSWANILAEQFKLVGGGEYKMPLTSNNVGGLVFGGNPDPRFGPRLFFTGVATNPLLPASGVGITTNEVLTSPMASGTYNNVGVPGAYSFHLLSDGYGQASNLASGLANPFYVRFAAQGGGAKSMLNYAYDQQPTFFSLWIGNNDVLGYATAGGVTKAQDANFGADITPVATFNFVYNTIVNKMATTAKGVVSNIPYVNTIPFFTTVPNAIALPQATVDQLNAGYAQYNGGLAAAAGAGLITQEEKNRRTLTFQAGVNRLVMVDEYLSPIQLSPTIILPKLRQTTSEDYLVLSSQGTTIGQAYFLAGNGTAIPLADRIVLSKDEVLELKTATDAYNSIIKAAATAKGLAFVDSNLLLQQVASPFGVSESGYTIKSTFATGGGFSHDGVHPAPRGYALIANQFIKEINKTYGSNLKGVDLGKYRFAYPATIGDGNK